MFPRNLLETEDAMSKVSIQKDLRALVDATGDLGSHLYEALGFSLGIGSILNWVALITGIYLFVVNRSEWRTNILTALLVPYIALNLPSFLFNIVRGQIGYWIAFVLVVLKLFVPKHYPEDAELPASLIVLLVVAPVLVVDQRFTWIGNTISIAIGIYLLYEHINNAGGVRKAFAERGVPVTIGIFALFISPLWAFFF